MLSSEKSDTTRIGRRLEYLLALPWQAVVIQRKQSVEIRSDRQIGSADRGRNGRRCGLANDEFLQER
jgi:hypothetical protein